MLITLVSLSGEGTVMSKSFYIPFLLWAISSIAGCLMNLGYIS